MQPRTKKEKTWANDVATVPPKQTPQTGSAEDVQTPEVNDPAVEQETEALDDLEWLKKRTVLGDSKQSATPGAEINAEAQLVAQVRALTFY